MGPRRDKALGELGRPITAVLDGAAAIGATDLRDEVIGFLCQDNDDLIASLVPALRAARAFSPVRRSASGLGAVAHHCARRLEARLARPPRAADDWSIENPGDCTCTLCDTLGEFLSDPVRRSFEWPLAEKGRHHVYSRIDLAELPVRHQTRRTGRPYTLVLTKTEALFERERQARRRDEEARAWLNGTWGTSDPAANADHRAD